jgi:ABC-2 type transport system ATP-binding protein
LGVRVHAVEPGRISLEERLLGILRGTGTGAGTGTGDGAGVGTEPREDGER